MLADTPPDSLRVLFITEDDPLYVREFFTTFLSEYPSAQFELVGLTVSRAFDESLIATARRVLGMYGPVDFARLLVRYGRRRITGTSIRSLAERHEVPLVETNSVNEPVYVSRVRGLSPDVIVSVAAPEIFKRPLLEVPRIRCVNIHSGRLPVYRGMMPVFWQVQKGERAVTITVHEMVERLDAGSVLGTAEVPIRHSDSLDRLMTEVKHEGARLMIRVLRDLARGTDTGSPVNMEGARYFSFPSRADARVVRARGHRML